MKLLRKKSPRLLRIHGIGRKNSEKSADDLLGLLNRVSRALGVTTHHILDQGGVVGDFQGDAAMGFWGWPIAHVDAVERAARAALAIRAELERAAEKKDDLLITNSFYAFDSKILIYQPADK